MRRLGNIYLSHREISILEAVYRTCGMPLKACTTDVVFIPTDKDSVRITLPLHTIQNNHNNNNPQLWTHNIVERYTARPETDTFNDLSLASFAAHYHAFSHSANRPTTDFTSDDCPPDNPAQTQEQPTQPDTKIKLLNNLGYIKKRSKAAVIRYPKFNKEKDSERYYENHLRLYLPHRRNLDLLPLSMDSYETFYTTGKIGQQLVRDIIKTNSSPYELNKAPIDAAFQAYQDDPNQQESWAELAPESELQRKQYENDRQNDQDPDDDDAIELPADLATNSIHLQTDTPLQHCSSSTTNTISYTQE
jgi:hypothetical protein